MIATVALVVALASPTPASGPPAVSKEMQVLKTRVERYFHDANDRLGGHRAYFLYSISRDGLGLILNVHQVEWNAVSPDVRRASIEDAKRWWKRNCAHPSRRCEIGISDDHGTVIVPYPSPKLVKGTPPPKR